MSVERTFTLANYVEFFGTAAYREILLATLYMSTVATIFGVLFGYPVAYSIARSTSLRGRKILLTLLLMSFLISSIARVYAFYVILGRVGILNFVVALLGLPSLRILNTEWAITVGLIHFSAPLSALTLIGPIQQVRPSLEEAAKSLGADELQTFTKVTLPLSIPGIVAAISLGYTVSVSAFLTPLFLGGGITNMMSNMIYARFELTTNYPFGAALSAILLLFSVSIAYMINKISQRVQARFWRRS